MTEGFGVAVYHVVYADEDFAHASKTLRELVHRARQKVPGCPCKLYLDIEGHRNSKGGFDSDMFRLMNEFILEDIMPLVDEAHTPLYHLKQGEEIA